MPKQTITISRELSDIIVPGKPQEAKLHLTVDPPDLHPFEVGILMSGALQVYYSRMIEQANAQLALMQKEHPEMFNPGGPGLKLRESGQ